MPLPPSQIIAQGMLRANTPVEDYQEQYGLFVKREDLACPPPGPPFSKTRGVYAHVKSRPEELIGVLDTFHSQAGHAVARACQILGKRCVNFFPVYKADIKTGKVPGEIPVGAIHILDNGVWIQSREPQVRSAALGATLVGLPAGRSCILYHAAKKATLAKGGYMMPNALKLEESVTETAKEVASGRHYDRVILPASSGTIAAGAIRGFIDQSVARDEPIPEFIVHLGYSRSQTEVVAYIRDRVDRGDGYDLTLVDEGYNYKDQARPGATPPWPCNPYYDLKAFRWWMRWKERHPEDLKRTLLWNVG